MADAYKRITTTNRSPKVGLLTRTIVASPVIRWILPARIRHRVLNDVVYVGEDFIEVKEVKSGGHAEPVISKRDLGSRIYSAKVFTIDDSLEVQLDNLLHTNSNYRNSSAPDLPVPVLPAQLLVLTLDANVLMFLYLARLEDGNWAFRHQIIPLVRSANPLHQLGQHIAIDPQSRAIAIASRGGRVVLYAAKPKQDFNNQLVAEEEEWCPVTQEKTVDDHGAIQHIAFLHPRRNDKENHVILLAVVTDPSTKRTRLRWYDWYVGRGVQALQSHTPIPIDAPRGVHTLLIPLYNTNFILTHGKHISLYRNLLSGSPVGEVIDNIGDDEPPVYPGNSPMHPLWNNWCRPTRSPGATQDRDFIYLCREDGKVFHLTIEQDGTMQVGSAGDLKCHVGEAFASLGDDREPDLLAVAADMSTGRIVSIGIWSSNRSTGRSRAETMGMELVELLPNWASITDMTVARVSSSTTRASQSRDSIFITSGRQPYGKITELRKGLEARLSFYIPLGNLSSTLDVWTLPDPPTGALICLLTTPETTSVYVMHDGGIIDRREDPGSFDITDRTLAADVTEDNHLIQVTRRRIIVAGSIDASFEDKQDVACEDGESIICAVIEPKLGLVVSCRSSSDDHFIVVHTTPIEHDTDDALITPGAKTALQSRALCMASATFGEMVLILVSEETGMINAFAASRTTMEVVGSFKLDEKNGALCDQMILLRPAGVGPDQTEHFLAVCSTRDGKLVTVPLSISPFSMGTPVAIPFGHSTVKLTRHSSEVDRAYAICGTDTCLLTIDGITTISISSIWAADKERPELLQNQIFGCTRLPSADRLSEADLHMLERSLVMVSPTELWVTTLAHNISTVPRQIEVAGTPYRLIYDSAQHRLVCASMCTEVCENETRRRCIPYIELISPRTGESTGRYSMEPGEDVYSLLAWSPRSNERDASYHFVVVGSRYLKHGNEDDVQGRVNFLRAQKDGTVKCQHVFSLEAAVYAMALFDDYTFAVCYGKYIALYRFSFDNHKVRRICQPVQMASSGTAITCHAPMMYVTTAQDSVTVFFVEDEPGGGTETCRLVVSSTSPRADATISHTIEVELALAVMSTRRKEVIGLNLPDHVQNGLARTSSIGFEATLPQSVTRVRACDIRPAWKSKPPADVLVGGLLGCCTNGSLIGLAVLDDKLWRRLFWLQRLCEWSAVTSPHTYLEAPFAASNEDERGSERALPIGLTGTAHIMLAAPDGPARAARDMHIDGDLLARLLERGGASTLRDMIEKTSERVDHVGEWVRAHLEEELAVADDCIAELSLLLNSWL